MATVSSVKVAVLRSFWAPTVMTFGELQGLVTVKLPVRPAFPAEHTTTIPASQSDSTACTKGSLSRES